MKRALVTGATGFIGGRLVHALVRDGWTIHCLCRPESDIRSLDPQAIVLRAQAQPDEIAEVMREAKPDIVFHLASLYLSDHEAADVDRLISSNVLFTALLAEAMTASGVVRLVNTGTAWQRFGVEDARDYNPVNLYAATKQAASDVLRYYHDARKLSLVTLELFDTYGRGDPRRKIVQLLVDAARSGDTLGLSPGEQMIDLTHVDDVIDAFLLAGRRLFNDNGRPRNERFLLSGERTSLRDLAILVGDTLGRPINVEFGARPYRPREVMEPVVAGTEDRLPHWHPQRSLVSCLPELAGNG
ncbi:NAD-dependent epimerase/dehydratase family protein [Qipengyuania spongiae]|uniref:NAD(P)-dependent oxidoreductase n=1 Tax=Qipengyuania spongiae TaxID=2909673 RepID=A0ABY5T2V1_9SPHN|nr:NAD(P)-dependent oxidoreductase [Qipengyuania spongiae]UVI40859.1 NAD(P)-dependent oxidoreductase [Qipengyuania spongiae]